MAEQLHAVDLETCTGDGICAEVCPENALELVDEKAATVEERADTCISCGQGVAVCPTIIGMIPPVVDRTKELRERYGIPKNNRVLTSLILGYPKFKYRQGIRRDLAAVQFNATVH